MRTAAPRTPQKDWHSSAFVRSAGESGFSTSSTGSSRGKTVTEQCRENITWPHCDANCDAKRVGVAVYSSHSADTPDLIIECPGSRHRILSFENDRNSNPVQHARRGGRVKFINLEGTTYQIRLEPRIRVTMKSKRRLRYYNILDYWEVRVYWIFPDCAMFMEMRWMCFAVLMAVRSNYSSQSQLILLQGLTQLSEDEVKLMYLLPKSLGMSIINYLWGEEPGNHGFLGSLFARQVGLFWEDKHTFDEKWVKDASLAEVRDATKFCLHNTANLRSSGSAKRQTTTSEVVLIQKPRLEGCGGWAAKEATSLEESGERGESGKQARRLTSIDH
ncbi:hypothetical protein C8R47DRAFT_1082939 [Mycena vitilis]|nr:hypothetical protein C8R47DRAFT_1082939 [Mycena vitilis]